MEGIILTLYLMQMKNVYETQIYVKLKTVDLTGFTENSCSLNSSVQLSSSCQRRFSETLTDAWEHGKVVSERDEILCHWSEESFCGGVLNWLKQLQDDVHGTVCLFNP